MRNILLFLVILFLALAIVAWVRHGGGEPYPDLSTPPRLSADGIETVLTYDEPIVKALLGID